MDAAVNRAVESGALPYEIVNPGGTAPALLVCDHGGRELPEGYGTLGVSEAELARHIGWDIGAADVTRRMADLLDAPAVLTRYSRLLVDCNRASDDPTFICEVSDGTVVPRNRGIDAAERAQRVTTYYDPYHRAVAETLAAVRRRHAAPCFLPIHSFTPSMKGRVRPWHVGVLWNKDPRLAVPLMRYLAEDGTMTVGDNEPYSGRSNVGYTMRHHAAAHGLPHALVEIRQDLIGHDEGVESWAQRLAGAMKRIDKDHGAFAPEQF
jgi:predicted N-formylglutamate amidohydrolase